MGLKQKVKEFFFGIPHKTEIFVFGTFAVTKCIQCGCESLPWEVDPQLAKDWAELNPLGAERYKEIELAERNYKCMR